MTWRNYWLSLSFANLVYLRAWSDLIPINQSDAFLRKLLPGYPLFFGVATDVIVLSLLTFLVVSMAPKFPAWLRRILPVLPLAILALTLRSLGGDGGRASIIMAAGGALMLFAGVLAVWFEAKAQQAMRVAALAALPCLAVTFAGTPVYLMEQHHLPPDQSPAPRFAGTPPLRVVWILFDDWDEKLTFDDRAVSFRMPVLDDLSVRSFRGTRALAAEAGLRTQPNMATIEAIPGLLYGKRLMGGPAENAKTERLTAVARNGTVEGNVVLGDPGTVFQALREKGWNSGATGWYLPYCRVLGAQLTDCWWDMRYIQENSAHQEYLQGGIDEMRMLFETSVFSPFGAALVDERHFAMYQALLEHGRKLAADPSLGLALIHLNVPHAPYFYDPKLGPSLRYGYQGSMYFEALQYLDRAIGEITSAVRNAGLEGKTAYIISSDHPFRYSGSGDVHVPYIVHLPQDNVGVLWSNEFSALVTRDLILAITSGELRTSADVRDFVTRRTEVK